MREDQVQNAVRFLQDPKVVSAPLAKKVAFLESKGLTSEEIETAMQRVKGGGTSTSAPSSTPAPPPAIPPNMVMQPMMPMQASPYNWKDYTLGAVAVVGAGYVLSSIKYVAPLISWPRPTDIQESTDKINAQVVSATKTLETVQVSTTDMIQAIQTQSENVSKSLSDMEIFLKELKEADERRDQDIQGIKQEVDTIREMIPKMFDKSRDSQTAAMTDLQNEVKSLKNLLLNRRIPLAANTSQEGLSSSSELSTNTTPKPSTFNLPTKPAIPAWQLEASTAKAETNANEE